MTHELDHLYWFLQKVIAATESVVGDLDLPETGILAAVPIARVRGLHRKREEL